MTKNYGIKRSSYMSLGLVTTGAFDEWGPSRHTVRTSNRGSVTRRLKKVPITLAPVPKSTDKTDMSKGD